MVVILPLCSGTMAACGGLLLLLLWCLLGVFPAAEGKELTVTCLNSEECVLPCHFPSDGKGARIMWYKKKAVVSCTRYGNTSFVVGHNSPAEKYRGRTGLFADQVLGGNATLVLRNVTPHDQGKYFCITMTAPRTDESSIISLVVKAPVVEVDMEFSGDSVTCSAADIYPAPALRWSTDPPTDAPLLRNSTKTWKNRLGFYDIQSSLKLPAANLTNQTYICCVTSETNKKTTFLKHEASIQASAGGGVQIPCSLPPGDLHSFNLTWRLSRSDSILSICAAGPKTLLRVGERWRPHVANGHLARAGLQLHGLKPEHQGSYTCEVSTPEGTYITWTDVTVAQDSKERMYIGIIIALCYFLCLSYGTLAYCGVRIFRLERAREREDGRPEGEALNVEEVATDDGPKDDDAEQTT